MKCQGTDARDIFHVARKRGQMLDSATFVDEHWSTLQGPEAKTFTAAQSFQDA